MRGETYLDNNTTIATAVQYLLCCLCVFHYTKWVFPLLFNLTWLDDVWQLDMSFVLFFCKHQRQMDESGAARCSAKTSKNVKDAKELSLLIYLSVCQIHWELKKDILFGICDWRECVISQHMTQTWTALRGEGREKKSSLHNCFKFHRLPRQPITEGSHNKSLTVWLQAHYDFLLGE